jgi:hypothetical protein
VPEWADHDARAAVSLSVERLLSHNDPLALLMHVTAEAAPMRISVRNLALPAALGLAVAVGCGCSLNPQPLPPGEQTEGGATVEYPADATTGATGDASAFSGNDAASADGSQGIPPNAGLDGGDAAATEDGASDAAVDALADGATE